MHKEWVMFERTPEDMDAETGRKLPVFAVLSWHWPFPCFPGWVDGSGETDTWIFGIKKWVLSAITTSQLEQKNQEKVVFHYKKKATYSAS